MLENQRVKLQLGKSTDECFFLTPGTAGINFGIRENVLADEIAWFSIAEDKLIIILPPFDGPLLKYHQLLNSAILFPMISAINTLICRIRSFLSLECDRSTGSEAVFLKDRLA